jgi:hypothetical protein
MFFLQTKLSFKWKHQNMLARKVKIAGFKTKGNAAKLLLMTFSCRNMLFILYLLSRESREKKTKCG